MRPVGLRTFTATPRLPKAWNAMSLGKVHAFGHSFDLAVDRVPEGLVVTVSEEGRIVQKETVEEGRTITITFDK